MLLTIVFVNILHNNILVTKIIIIRAQYLKKLHNHTLLSKLVIGILYLLNIQKFESIF